MSLSVTMFIAIDDNTPNCETPFANPPSVWSLQHDYGLSGCKDYKFFAALGYPLAEYEYEGGPYPVPLIPLRGMSGMPALPPDIHKQVSLEGDSLGWLSGAEFFAVLEHARLDKSHLGQAARALVGVVDFLGSLYGHDRVRLIFVFFP